jgi:hypothetical protein
VGLALGASGPSCCPSWKKKAGTAGADGLPEDWSMVAYCCLQCDQCEVHIATQNNDEKLRAKVAKEWGMDASKLYCDGCKSERALFSCEAKKCAAFRGLPSCAHCDYFPVCDKDVWIQWPQLKEKVENMRAGLRLS